jgi:hypothetical protein
MSILKCAALGIFALAATATCVAQHKFPLRSGEWLATMPMPGSQTPMTMLFCLNDDLWEKAFSQNPSCKISEFNLSSTAVSYQIDCDMKSMTMKGRIDGSFDGMEHMTSKATLDMTMNGKATQSSASTDWRFKGATCNPDADMNLKLHKEH